MSFTRSDRDKDFRSSISNVYESHLVPLIFAPYADDLVRRLAQRGATRILEIAAGTGVVTRAMAAALPATVSIVATDLNQPMIDVAKSVGTVRPVEWRQADAMALPFADGSFDAVVCQFGVMFFPDKATAFAEVRRVLAPGGVFIFSAWDRIEDNEVPYTVTRALAALFSDDAPRFMARTPHGYFDRAVIARDLVEGGFTQQSLITTVEARSRAASPRDAAIAFCLGTPLRNEIEARDAHRLDEAIDAATEAVAARFGQGVVDGRIQAHVVVIDR